MNKTIVTLKDGRTFEHEGCVDVQVMQEMSLLKVVMEDDGFFIYNFGCVESVCYKNGKEGA